MYTGGGGEMEGDRGRRDSMRRRSRGRFTGALVKGGVAQRKHSNGNQRDLVLNISFVCMFFFVFSLRLKLP